jgi:hypothetical protein
MLIRQLLFSKDVIVLIFSFIVIISATLSLSLLYQEPLYPIKFMVRSNNSILIYEFVPNLEQKFNGYGFKLSKTSTVKINSDGFRDREFVIIKPNSTFRITALGSAYTFGEGVELDESYPKVLEIKLNSLKNELRIPPSPFHLNLFAYNLTAGEVYNYLVKNQFH